MNTTCWKATSDQQQESTTKKTINTHPVIPATAISILLFTFVSCLVGTPSELKNSPFASMKGVPLKEVRWTEGFWAEKFDLCRRQMLPSIHRALLDKRNGEVLENLKIAAGLATGKYHGKDWSDGDCYKWIEAMAFTYALTQDPELDRLMDEWIGIIGKAQQPDGYISTNMQLRKRPPYMQHPRNKENPGAYHEMYNMGHLLTAACSHYESTGKSNFLAIARKLADHLERTLKPGAPEIRVVAGNLPQIMGFIDMYRITGEQRYLQAAQVGIDIRGTLPNRSDLTQDHVPFRDESTAVGHSVFATYLYAGAADIYAETGERALWKAVERIWQNAALRRTYITGGACAIPNGLSARGDEVHEAFGADYELPNRTAYNETCANIGNAMWNWRLLQITGDAKYADMMETVLYNSGLSPVTVDGQKFFYANPLTHDFNTDGCKPNHTSERWSLFFGYCCPPQVARTIAGLGRWAYSVSEDALWVHLYSGNALSSTLLNGGKVALTQQTRYPWDGRITIQITEAPKKEMALMLRIPGWAQNPVVTVNGKPFTRDVKAQSYAKVKRAWSPGDVVELNFPMPVQLMEAHPMVKENNDHVAVQRGPVVYCLELPKSENGEQLWASKLCLPENANLTPRFERDFLGGVVTITGQALKGENRPAFVEQNAKTLACIPTSQWKDVLYQPLKPRELKPPASGTIDIKLIPYFAWANRGPAYMRVWIPLAR